MPQPAPRPPRPTLAALALAALAAVAWTGAAQALTIQFRDVSSNGAMTAEQLGAFQAAASYWESRLSDPVTVYIDIGLDHLGASVLGGTASSFASVS